MLKPSLLTAPCLATAYSRNNLREGMQPSAAEGAPTSGTNDSMGMSESSSCRPHSRARIVTCVRTRAPSIFCPAGVYTFTPFCYSQRVYVGAQWLPRMGGTGNTAAPHQVPGRASSRLWKASTSDRCPPAHFFWLRAPGDIRSGT